MPNIYLFPYQITLIKINTPKRKVSSSYSPLRHLDQNSSLICPFQAFILIQHNKILESSPSQIHQYSPILPTQNLLKMMQLRRIRMQLKNICWLRENVIGERGLITKIKPFDAYLKTQKMLLQVYSMWSPRLSKTIKKTV